MTKYSISIVSVLFVCGVLGVQQTIWQPSVGHTQVAIWPGTPPDAYGVPGTEYVETTKDERVAGKPYVWVSNITRPTMTATLRISYARMGAERLSTAVSACSVV